MNKFRSESAIIFFVLPFCFATAANAYFYQINSESINSPKTNTVQADLKLLLGVGSEDLTSSQKFFNRYKASVGTYSFYQSADDPSYYLRNGFLFQFRTNLYLNNFFFQFENHEFQTRTSISESNNTATYNWISENRFGLIFSKFMSVSSELCLDTYFETFLIPEVIKNELLSTLRSDLIYKISENSHLNPFAELYFKQLPVLVGSNTRELRFGGQWRPSASVSLKLMANVLPASSVSNTGILFQLNIFNEGIL